MKQRFAVYGFLAAMGLGLMAAPVSAERWDRDRDRDRSGPRITISGVTGVSHRSHHRRYHGRRQRAYGYRYRPRGCAYGYDYRYRPRGRAYGYDRRHRRYGYGYREREYGRDYVRPYRQYGYGYGY